MFSVLAGLVLVSAGVLEVNPGAAIVVFIVELALLLTLSMALAASRVELPETFASFNESVSGAFQVITFVVFAALIVGTGWFQGSTLALGIRLPRHRSCS